jgi:hypothetical protein
LFYTLSRFKQQQKSGQQYQLTAAGSLANNRHNQQQSSSTLQHSPEIDLHSNGNEMPRSGYIKVIYLLNKYYIGLG